MTHTAIVLKVSFCGTGTWNVDFWIKWQNNASAEPNLTQQLRVKQHVTQSSIVLSPGAYLSKLNSGWADYKLELGREEGWKERERLLNSFLSSQLLEALHCFSCG